MGNTPTDYATPKWEEAGKIHEWKNYINDEVRTMWPEFTDAQRAALVRQAEYMADCEEWD